MSIPEEYRRLRECNWGASNQWVEGRDRRREPGLGGISMSFEGRDAGEDHSLETCLPHH
jgi:hypothetical protein